MSSVQWMQYIVLGLIFHQIYRNQASPVFTYNPNEIQSFHIQSARNIRHSPCTIRKTRAEGICMFSIDCIKANGTHLGTCNDRFYIGSCCKLKDDVDIIEAEFFGNNIDQNTLSSTTPIIPTHKTTSKGFYLTRNPIGQRINTTIRLTSTKAPMTSTELHTSKMSKTTENTTKQSIQIVTKENSTNKIQTMPNSTSLHLPPFWTIVSNVLSLQKDSVKITKPPTNVTQSMINSWSTRFTSRKPQITSSAKPTTVMIPTTTDEMLDFATEEPTIFDRLDEITTATDFNDFDYTTTMQSVDVPTTAYQSETSFDGLIELTTLYDSTIEYEMDFTTASIQQNNDSSTDETMEPITVTNVPSTNSSKEEEEEEEEEETTESILASTTEPVSFINSTNSETYEIEGSSTSTENSTSEFMELSTTEEMSSSTSILLNGLEKANYKQVCGKRLYRKAKIVGGTKASFGRWPWQISLRQWHTSTFLHKCGAALLNENWAITAAHCVDNVSPADLLLRLGEFNIGVDQEPYPYQDRRVQIVVSYPQFDSRTFEYDLALMRFHEPAVFQPNIIPVCLPETDDNFIGRNAFVTGWGRLYEDGPLPSILQEVPVPILNNTLCEQMYRSAGYEENIPSNSFMCAGHKNGGRDSCEGDSGGPLVIQREDKRFLLAGVISWGINCAEPNQPGIYTRLSEFREWINQIIQI